MNNNNKTKDINNDNDNNSTDKEEQRRQGSNTFVLTRFPEIPEIQGRAQIEIQPPDNCGISFSAPHAYATAIKKLFAFSCSRSPSLETSFLFPLNIKGLF